MNHDTDSPDTRVRASQSVDRSATVSQRRRLRADGGQPPVVVKIGGANAVDPEGAVGDIADIVE